MRPLLNALRRFATTPQPATGENLVLTLSCPHKYYYKSAQVDQVNISAASGNMGILARHIPTIQQLRPGIIEVLVRGTAEERIFTSGGFAIMNPDSTLDITMTEAYPLDAFDSAAISKNIADAKQTLSSASASEHDRIQAEVYLEVFQALETALATTQPVTRESSGQSDEKNRRRYL
jgi:F-type H+-transporting ATPase subunit delta